MQEMEERKAGYFQFMEAIPTQVYLGLALGSIALSAITRLAGKKDAAVFFGQWPPTFLLFAMAHKILRPSQESATDQAGEAMDAGRRMVAGQ